MNWMPLGGAVHAPFKFSTFFSFANPQNLGSARAASTQTPSETTE
jgi:hypothetical protein